MSIEISYKDLRKDMFSDNALALLSEFVSTWSTNTGELIDVESDDVVIHVFMNAKRSDNRRLRSIYLHLLAEFTNIIERSITRCDPMLAHHITSQIVKGRTCRFEGREFIA